MPMVGTKKFAYTEKGKKEAKEYAKKTGKKVRRRLMKQGRVKKGDKMDIDHKKALSKGGSNGHKNLRVVPRRVNRAKDNN